MYQIFHVAGSRQFVCSVHGPGDAFAGECMVVGLCLKMFVFSAGAQSELEALATSWLVANASSSDALAGRWRGWYFRRSANAISARFIDNLPAVA
jgi:hypothetical protein